MWQTLKDIGCLDKKGNIASLDVNGVSDYFKSCQSVNNQNIFDETVYEDGVDSLFFYNISYDDLYLVFSMVKSNAIGQDEIPLQFLKILLPYIDTHILHKVNSILTTSVYPRVWKTARVTPIPKNGKPVTYEDFRPISILSALSKVVENIIKQ